MFAEAARVRILAETGWKRWVASDAGPGVAPNFITRALNSGGTEAARESGGVEASLAPRPSATPG